MKSKIIKLKHCIEVYRIAHQIQGKFQEDINLIENEKWEPFYSYYKKYSVSWLIEDFQKNGKPFKRWNTIPKEQYKNLLERYMEMGIQARIPDDVVDSWVRTIMINLSILISYGKIYARGIDYPFEELQVFFPDIPTDVVPALDYLDEKGLFPPRYEPYTDVANGELYKILKDYNERLEPFEKLILVNRCLDVTHHRGKMVEFFLEGGRGTAEAISKKPGD